MPPDPSLVEYLGLVNRLIDGLCQDPQAFDRFVMGLSAFIDFRPPASVTNLAQLFQHLRQVGLCSPDNLELLEKILSSMNRSHLVELVQAFKSRGGGKGSELSGSRGNDGRGKGSEPSRGGQDSGPGGNCKVCLVLRMYLSQSVHLEFYLSKLHVEGAYRISGGCGTSVQ